MNIEERSRIDRMLRLGCIVCRHFSNDSQAEVHHLTDGGRRLGHWYTLPLCPGHHRGVWCGHRKGCCLKDPGHSIESGRRVFEQAYGSQRVLWEEVQQFLGLEAKWPDSKITSRVA